MATAKTPKLPPIDPAKAPVWLPYGRKSHDDAKGDQRLTQKEQRTTTLHYCARRIAEQGRGRIGPWRFDDETGQRNDREHYQATLAEARELRRAGHPVVVAIRQLDRFGRDGEELFRAWKEFAVLDVPVHDVSMNGPIPPTVFPYLVGNAVVQSLITSANIRRVYTSLRAQGWWKPGKPGWGYRSRPPTAEELAAGAPEAVLDSDPPAAEKMAEAFRRAAGGESVHSLARWTATLPEAVRGGRSLAYAPLRELLRSRVYIAQSPDGQPGKWPAITDPETWERAQASIAAGSGLAKQASGTYLLTGMLWCPRCGARMVGGASSHKGDRWRRYSCTSSRQGAKYAKAACYFAVSQKLLEDEVLARVTPLLTGLDAPEHRAALLAAWDELRHPPVPTRVARDLRRAEAAEQLAKRRLDTATLKLLDGTISEEAYAGAVAKIERDRAAAARELKRLNATTPPPPELPPLDVVLAEIGGWRAALKEAAETGALGKLRDILDFLIERVTPVRLERGQYDARIDWTPAGEAAGLVTERLAA